MRNLILAFSATGNTERLVGIIAAELEKAGQECVRGPIEAGAAPPRDLESFDRVLVAFPVLAKMPPVFVRRFLQRMPRGVRPDGSGIEAAVLATAGGEGGPAAMRGAAILRRKGYLVSTSVRVSYPDNWAQVGAVPHDEAALAAELARGDQRARELASALAKGAGEKEAIPPGLVVLGHCLGFLFGFFGRRFMGKLFAADSSCTGCGLCARSCPVGAIRLARRKKALPFWRMNCESCNRCINICPSGAIRASVLGAILQVASIGLAIALTLRAFELWLWPFLAPLTGSALGPLIHAVLVAAVVLASHFLSIGPLDFLVYRALRGLPGLKRAFALPFPGTMRRYRAPGFRP
jgi:ferredoxin